MALPILPAQQEALTAPSVQCDLCESPFTLPAEIAAQGVIYGLLVCTQCIEDELCARADEPRSEVGLVGGGR
jgi:hypothetical protein